MVMCPLSTEVDIAVAQYDITATPCCDTFAARISRLPTQLVKERSQLYKIATITRRCNHMCACDYSVTVVKHSPRFEHAGTVVDVLLL
jgi:hypothetical protein